MSEQHESRRPRSPGHGGFRRGQGGPGRRMGMPVEKPKDFKGTFKRLLIYLKPYRMRFLFVILFAILSTVFTIVSPKILGRATTKLFSGAMQKLKGVPGASIDFHYIAQILIVLAGLYLISAVFNYLQQYLMAGIAQKTVYEMRKDVNEKVFRLPLKFFDSHSHGDTLSRLTNDIENISNTLQQSLTQLITSVVTLIGIIVMMLSISPIMFLIVILTLPLSLLVTRMIASRSQKFFKSQQKNLGVINGHVEEMFTGHTIVKAFNREKESVQTFNKINEDLYNAGWRAQFVSGIIMPLMMFISNLAYVCVSVVGGILVTNRVITIGDVQAFIQYARQFNQPLTQAANIANIIQSTIASAERVFELLDEDEEVPEAKNDVELLDSKGNVAFEEVSFRYQEDEPLIDDMSIEVKQGQTVAIVGPTGAGKTTLVNLLMRFYELNKGRITIDGVDITDLKRKDLRQIFGMVLQDAWLFNGTIRDNIAYGHEGATEKEVIEAAKAAYADSFIRTLPDGYETRLNEEASNISQGQKQLLTIARAILAKPSIMILDEATSSVDTRTEVHIQTAMENLMKGHTSFVIAHRLSTIRDADLILVMNKGQIIEKGTHDELLVADGFYADLYYSQFAGKAI